MHSGDCRPAAPTDAFGAFSSTQRVVLAKANGSFGFGFDRMNAAGIPQLYG